MDALVAMLAAGTKLRGAALTAEGAATVATAAKILDALLGADLLRCGRAFVEAGGFAALRVCVACAQLGGPRGLEARICFLLLAALLACFGTPHSPPCPAPCPVETGFQDRVCSGPSMTRQMAGGGGGSPPCEFH